MPSTLSTRARAAADAGRLVAPVMARLVDDLAALVDAMTEAVEAVENMTSAADDYESAADEEPDDRTEARAEARETYQTAAGDLADALDTIAAELAAR